MKPSRPLLLLVSALVLPTAQAADPVKMPLLTMAELRTCMDDKDAIAQRRADLERDMAERDVAVKAFEAEGERLGADQAAIDAKDPAVVLAFNQRVADHNAKAERYNAEAAALNGRAGQLKTDSAGYRDRCVDRRFSSADQQAILKERARAASAPKP
jgi:hypothetical protein